MYPLKIEIAKYAMIKFFKVLLIYYLVDFFRDFIGAIDLIETIVFIVAIDTIDSIFYTPPTLFRVPLSGIVRCSLCLVSPLPRECRMLRLVRRRVRPPVPYL